MINAIRELGVVSCGLLYTVSCLPGFDLGDWVNVFIGFLPLT